MPDWTSTRGIEYPTATPTGEAGEKLKNNFVKLANRSPVIVSNVTTNATPTELFIDGVASDRLNIASDTTWAFEILVAARRTDADNESAAWKFEGAIDNNAGTTALVSAVAETVLANDSAWSVAVTADNTNDALVVTVTGQASKTIQWVARVTIVEAAG